MFFTVSHSCVAALKYPDLVCSPFNEVVLHTNSTMPWGGGKGPESTQTHFIEQPGIYMFCATTENVILMFPRCLPLSWCSNWWGILLQAERGDQDESTRILHHRNVSILLFVVVVDLQTAGIQCWAFLFSRTRYALFSLLASCIFCSWASLIHALQRIFIGSGGSPHVCQHMQHTSGDSPLQMCSQRL